MVPAIDIDVGIHLIMWTSAARFEDRAEARRGHAFTSEDTRRA